MLVGCPRCARKYRVDDTRMSRTVMTVRCSSCCSLFRIVRPDEDPGSTALRPGSGESALPRILVAHESPAFCDAVRSTLKGEPWEVAVCHDGVAALALLRSQDVAVTLLDVALPGRYGFEICEELRADHLLAGVKVILFASIYDRTRYKRLPCTLYGADDYIEKHHIPDLLVAKIRKLLDGRNRDEAPVDGGDDRAADGRVPTEIRENIDETRAFLKHEEEEETTVSPETVSRMPEARVKARRLARIIASDIALYNQKAVEEGVRASTFFSLLADDIAEGRALYQQRVAEEIRSTTTYLDDAFSDLIDKVRKELNL